MAAAVGVGAAAAEVEGGTARGLIAGAVWDGMIYAMPYAIDECGR